MSNYLESRKNLIKKIVDYIFDSNYTNINISGAPGTGKTFLLNSCANIVENRSDDVAVISLYGDAGRKNISLFPIDRYLSQKNRWKNNFGALLEGIPYIGPLFGYWINANDIRHIMERDNVILQSANLKRHIQFSKEILMILKRKNQIVLLCDDFQYFDKESVDYIYGLLFHFNKFQSKIHLITTSRTGECDKHLLPIIKALDIHLKYPSKSEIITILRDWGNGYDFTEQQVNEIYTATGGHLYFLQLVCQSFCKINNDCHITINKDYYLDIVNQRIMDSSSREEMVELLECLSLIGKGASIHELKCVLSQSSVSPIIQEAIAMNILIREDSYISFVSDSLRESLHKVNDKSIDFYKRYSICLKYLMPSAYDQRAIIEKYAQNEQQSQIYIGMHLISLIRKGYQVNIQNQITNMQVREVVKNIADAYALSFTGQNDTAINLINNIIHNITIPLLYVEAKYTECVFQYKSNREMDRYDALQSLNSLIDNFTLDEFELYNRLIRICISLCCSLKKNKDAKTMYNTQKKELMKRMKYDRTSRYAYYELLLLCDSIYDPITSHVVLLQSIKDLEQTVNNGKNEYIFLLYKTLINFSSNCIEIGHFQESELMAFRAIRIAKQCDYIKFTYLDAAYNNYLLSLLFQQKISYVNIINEFKYFINNHLYEEDDILIRLNFAGVLLMNDQISDALNCIAEIKINNETDYDPYYIYYYYINKSITVYLSGDQAFALELLDKTKELIDYVSNTRSQYYTEHFKLLYEILSGKESCTSIKDLQQKFLRKRPHFLSSNWMYYITVYLFSDLQIWSDF